MSRVTYEIKIPQGNQRVTRYVTWTQRGKMRILSAKKSEEMAREEQRYYDQWCQSQQEEARAMLGGRQIIRANLRPV